MSSKSSFKLDLCTLSTITPHHLSQAAALFSNHYGTWSPSAPLATRTPSLIPGTNIKISPSRLKSTLLPPHGENFYISAREEDTGELVGQVFASWYSLDSTAEEEKENVLWITQLLVHTSFRQQGIAVHLLHHLKSSLSSEKLQFTYVGVLSSNPFTLKIVLDTLAQGFNPTHLVIEQKDVRRIMEKCPVQYAREAKLRVEEGEEVVRCADTGFWIDHGDSERAFQRLKERGVEWRFGELPEGCEFLGIGRVKVC